MTASFTNANSHAYNFIASSPSLRSRDAADMERPLNLERPITPIADDSGNFKAVVRVRYFIGRCNEHKSAGGVHRYFNRMFLISKVSGSLSSIGIGGMARFIAEGEGHLPDNAAFSVIFSSRFTSQAIPTCLPFPSATSQPGTYRSRLCA